MGPRFGRQWLGTAGLMSGDVGQQETKHGV